VKYPRQQGMVSYVQSNAPGLVYLWKYWQRLADATHSQMPDHRALK
jgi:hypothetical protein